MAIVRSKRINSNKRSALKNVLLISLLTGTLDAIAAILLIFKSNPKINLEFISESVFRFIASGAYGKGALAGGSEMVVSGLIFHYTIAFLFTTVFYQLYPTVKSAFKNKYVIGIFYGVLAWVIMNMAVVPLSKIGYHPIKLPFILSGMAALVICLGLPIALIADWQLKKNKK
ncbi:MAG: hypothetical protein JWQ79_477 [Mucilaginibacter sp.]|jgi:hypothetical protein|nr:hypothetical protein [Mucilaginibacter sp.]